MDNEELAENVKEHVKNERIIDTVKRPPLQSDLDHQVFLVDTDWGKDTINPDLIRKFLKYKGTELSEDGKLRLTAESLWGQLSVYTKDLRLGNLDSKGTAVCVHNLNLAGDMLREDFPEPALICLSRVATEIELSQSRQGFFRKILTTVTQSFKGENDPPKKSMLTGKHKGGY